jgi:hypothetical protein
MATPAPVEMKSVTADCQSDEAETGTPRPSAAADVGAAIAIAEKGGLLNTPDVN